MNKLFTQAVLASYANDFDYTDTGSDAFTPELWAHEGLAILEENMVAASLVHRDFSMEVANFGDVVNTRRPGVFKSKRKVDSDSIVLQDATATNVQVPLDQHFYISFTIRDGEASKSFQDLIQIYLLPGMQGIARGIDRAILGQVHKFLDNKVGKLQGLTSSTAKDTILEARETLNRNLAYPQGRNMVLAPGAETAMLQTELFIAAMKRGDGGAALREASLGRILGFDTYMDQNTPAKLAASADTFAGTSNNAHAAGTAANANLNVVILGIEVLAGEYVVFEENGQPTTANGSTSSTNTTVVHLEEALKYAVTATGVVTAYQHCHTGNTTYTAGYSKGIAVASYTAGKQPTVGQLVSFGVGTTRHTYTIIEAYLEAVEAGTCVIWLDRPLDRTVTAGDAVFPGPAGTYNLALHKDALALVSRPLALPNTAMGVRSQVANYNDIAMRVSMQYQISAQGTVVTLDLLAGIALLDARLGCVLLG
jgi:hypothetical protein